MEGPYRDLGNGFARLTGIEGSRRGPSAISSVEDALLELARNARDAGASNIYVASSLHKRRYRTLTVLDDGCGVPESYRETVFEPGVTTRHLAPIHDTDASPHGAGLSLFHIRRSAIDASVTSPKSPTAISVTFDTEILPERALQSGSRESASNLKATLAAFLQNTPPGSHPPNIYLSSPAQILAILHSDHIIQTNRVEGLTRGISRFAEGVGIRVSVRTVQRISRGDVAPAARISAAPELGRQDNLLGKGSPGQGGRALILSDGEEREIWAILARSARSSYLEVGNLEVENRGGRVILKAEVFEPEEEYE